jgi:hypothetical protein
MQTRGHSALETIANVVIGYIGAVTSQVVLFPLFGITVKPSTNLVMGAWFTVVSVIRSYTVRRLFARWESR